MTTFADLVAQVKQQLIGYSKDQATITFLVSPMSSTDTTFAVDQETATAITRGLVEIDDELLLVKKFDRTSGVVTVMAGTTGRGQAGTVAASHTADTIVISDPRYPVSRIKEAINDTIDATFPDLWVFDDLEFPKVAARYEYPMPADAEDVYKVTFNTIGPSKVWLPSQSWRFNPLASTTSQIGQDSGKSIQVMDGIVPGRAVRVSYTKKPNNLVNNSDEFVTVTGYPERYTDLITYGATARMLGANESARLQQQAIESTERAPLVPTGAAVQAAQYYWALYRQRLNEERDRLFRLFDSYQYFNA
jgi:hypothetical protein